LSTTKVADEPSDQVTAMVPIWTRASIPLRTVLATEPIISDPVLSAGSLPERAQTIPDEYLNMTVR
jgi:hypothetical protein